jgi:membrane protease YdiL (CAAX protease family)
VEVVRALVTLTFVWLTRKEMRRVVSFNGLKWYMVAGVIGVAAAASFLVSLSVREVNVTFFGTDVSYYGAYKLYSYPTFVMIYSIAVTPAIFEELAFRGVIYNYCASFLDERLVVAVTAFLFAIMHLSLISLVWLIPFGFFIGSLRRKYNTIWYGVAFHFMFNLTACIIDLYRQGELL